MSREFYSFLKTEGIRHELTISKHPEQNGVSERLNRTLVESVKSMLADTQLPHKFQAEVLSIAVLLRYLSFTSIIPRMTQLQVRRPSGKKPNAYSHIPKDERGKLSNEVQMCTVWSQISRMQICDLCMFLVNHHRFSCNSCLT